MLVTYARLPPEDLYHTSVDGLRGGLGRALVFLNFPVALAALPVILVCLDRLGGRRGFAALGAAGLPLCLLVLVPGVVDQDDLDAKPVNALPFAGVLVALALTVAAARRGAAWGAPLRGDALRLVLALLLVVIGIPWLFAETGFYAPDPILADEVPTDVDPSERTLPSVHLGNHHGTNGVLLALAALALSRTLPAMRSRLLLRAASLLLALMLAYGLANALQDFTLEQLYKRGTIDWKPPTVLRPELSWGWLGILVTTALIEVGWFRRERRRSR